MDERGPIEVNGQQAQAHQPGASFPASPANSNQFHGCGHRHDPVGNFQGNPQRHRVGPQQGSSHCVANQRKGDKQQGQEQVLGAGVREYGRRKKTDGEYERSFGNGPPVLRVRGGQRHPRNQINHPAEDPDQQVPFAERAEDHQAGRQHDQGSRFQRAQLEDGCSGKGPKAEQKVHVRCGYKATEFLNNTLAPPKGDFSTGRWLRWLPLQ